MSPRPGKGRKTWRAYAVVVQPDGYLVPETIRWQRKNAKECAHGTDKVIAVTITPTAARRRTK